MGSQEIKLKKLAMRDLPLFEVDERLKKYKDILDSELRAKGVRFKFHVWVSDDWFCPDGVPGFALPFYLFNQELMKIQRQEMGFVEGRTEKEILKLMRHELGHAIDNAYGLRKVKERILAFGLSTLPYPRAYSPQKYSRRFVNYLGDNYSQSHPDEDFAETFAYWLDPEKDWKNRKLSGPVLSKLKVVDQLMSQLKNMNLKLNNQFCVDSIGKNTKLLSQHYRELKNQRKFLLFKPEQKLKTQKNTNQVSNKTTHLKYKDNFKTSNANTNQYNPSHSLSKGHNAKATQRLLPANLQKQSHSTLALLKKRKEEIASQVSKNLGFPKYKVKHSIDILLEQQKSIQILLSLKSEKKLNYFVQKNFIHLNKTNQLKFFL